MGQVRWAARTWAALILIGCCCTAAQAQAGGAAPGALVPRTPAVVPSSSELAPLQVIPDTQIKLPDAPPPPRELGKPDDDMRIDVARFVVDDSAPAELRAALPRLTARFIGTNRSFEDLVGAAAEVTRFLQSDLGYYLGYAYLPEQDPSNGAIRIAVLEGRLDRVVLNWVDGLPVDRVVVQAYLDHLKPGSVLLVRDVERVVFLVNDLRGLTARFDVQAGRLPGTADLVVTPRADSVWSGRADADINGSRYLGAYRLGGLVQMNSPFGRGDGFTANALVSTTRGLAFALLGYTSPVGSDGFKVGASLSLVKYQLDKQLFPLDLNGSALTATGYGVYPLIRSRNLNLFTVGSLDHKAYEDRQVAADSSSRKNVDTLGLGATGDFRDSLLGGAVNTFDATLVNGRVNYPAGRPAGLEDAPNFTKLVVGYSRLQDLLTGRLLGYAALRSQLAMKNLDTTEQFRVGGPDAVRAFATGEGTGDEGAVLSLELRLLPPEAWLGRIAREMVVSAFYDAGYVRYRHQPLAGAVGTQSNTGVFTGVGLGLSWESASDYALRMSVSNPISGTPRSDPQVRKPRLFLLATKRFN
jgi:hemolysin activation/secretion protein